MRVVTIGQLDTNLQPHIHDAVNDALSDMLEPLKQLLSNVTVKLAKKMIDILPDGGFNIAEEGILTGFALYDSSDKTICLSQTYEVKRSVTMSHGNPLENIHEWLFEPNEQAEGKKYTYYESHAVPDFLYHAFLHEAGHAVYDGHIDSETIDELTAAYNRDLDALNQKDIEERHRILEENCSYFSALRFNQGRTLTEFKAVEEVFAEAFSNIVGGTNKFIKPHLPEKRPSEDHKKLFENCYAVVEQAILRIAPDVVLYPTHVRSYETYVPDKPEPRKINGECKSVFAPPSSDKENPSSKKTRSRNTSENEPSNSYDYRILAAPSFSIPS